MKYLFSFLATLTICGCATKQHSATLLTDEKQVMFAMLGYISEYGSRFYVSDPKEYEIETFFPAEAKQAVRFEMLMRTYHNLLNHPYDVKKEIGKQGHILFRDKWMCEQINQHYKPAPKPYDRIYTIDQEFILNGNEEQISAYIESVLDRNGFKGEKNEISLANAPYKSETIAKALIQIGSDWSTIYVSQELVPTSYWIHFSPPPSFSYLKEVDSKKLKLDPQFAEWRSFKKHDT